MKLLKQILSFSLLLLVSSGAFADTYSWYWGGDVLPRDYAEYCDEPGIANYCSQTCGKDGFHFPNNGIGEGNGQAYCKQLVTHYKLWCSCDTSGSNSYPTCPMMPLISPTNAYSLIAGDTSAKCSMNCDFFTYGLNTLGTSQGVCMSGGEVVCQCDWVDMSKPS